MKNRTRYLSESHVLSICRLGPDEVYITASTDQAKAISPAAPYRDIAQFLSKAGMQIVQERIFGSLTIQQELLRARHQEFASAGLETKTPLTFIQGDPWHGNGLAGVQIHARTTTEEAQKVRTLMAGDQPCGRIWQNEGITFVNLQGIHGAEAGNSQATPARQAECMLDRAEQILRSNGLTYRQVVRTWIYLADILDWYGPFNAVRNNRYQQWGLMPNPAETDAGKCLLLPCSTGIRGKNNFESACVLDLLAIATPSDKPLPYQQLSNPSQQDAFRYGSAFSRGVIIQQSQGIQFHLSGTAAINNRGQSEYEGDARRQIEATLDHIEMLIKPLHLNLHHVCGATVFLKHIKDASIYREVASKRGLEDLPAVFVVADVCRSELLFEMDAIFASPQRTGTQ